jgi:hypothetical protein
MRGGLSMRSITRNSAGPLAGSSLKLGFRTAARTASNIEKESAGAEGVAGSPGTLSLVDNAGIFRSIIIG